MVLYYVFTYLYWGCPKMANDVLSHIELKGFTSIRHADIDLKPINVLIGGNAAGKSNLVSFFKMLAFTVTESLQLYVGRTGSANSLLYYGSKRTPQLEATLTFETNGAQDTYHLRLVHAAEDTLIFAEEEVRYHKPGFPDPQTISLGAGHKETNLNNVAETDPTVEVVRNILSRCKFFQFHDTSAEANIRGKCQIEQNQYLYKDAGNLAAYLYALKDRAKPYYRRIVDTIRDVAPQFDDFYLEPDRVNENLISLNWQEPGSEYVFGPHQLSDGLLRFMALATVLLQPEDELPNLIVIDEPELGLHPYAIRVLAGLVRKAASRSQIILATQSATLVNEFEPEDIITVDRQKVEPDRAAGEVEWKSVFRRLDVESLGDWLEEYTMGELWEKNVIGGRPSR